MKPSVRPQGQLFVFEGVDGVGKTTVSGEVAKRAASSGSNVGYYAFPGSEPHTLGLLIYNLHHRPSEYGVTSMTPASRQALHIAAHLDAIERYIVPTLLAGGNLIMDRFWWSTWVYGTIAGIDERILRALIAAEKECWGATKPAAVILITADNPRGEMSSDELTDWREKQQLYGRLAEEENSVQPTHELHNDGSLTSAVDQAITILANHGLTQ